jgi:hypothetical protein
MGKKANPLSISKEPGIQRNQEDKVINDLIKKRKLQQEALTKIMTSMDVVIERLNHSTTELLNGNNKKRLPK